jgi:hypothetical protein
MAFKNTVQWMPAIIVDSAGINPGNWLLSNAAGLPFPAFIFRIVNGSNTTVEISYDGVHVNDVVRPEGDLTLNLMTNALNNGSMAAFKQGAHVYLRGIAGVGNIYITGYYQEMK